MRIAWYDAEEWHADRCKDLACEFHMASVREETAVDAEVLSLRGRGRVTRVVLDAMPSLRLVATRSTGYDHIDLAACRERGITVCNAPGYSDESTAKHVFTLLEQLGVTPATLGVIGAGRIGKRVIEQATMPARAYDIVHDDEAAKRLGFEYGELEDVLACDVVTLHCNLTEETKRIIDEQSLRLMQPHGILINCARGGLVDTKALIGALKRREIGGAGLDVLSVRGREDAFDTPEAAELERLGVVLTHHEAANGREARERAVAITLENIRAFLDGKPAHVVDSR